MQQDNKDGQQIKTGQSLNLKLSLNLEITNPKYSTQYSLSVQIFKSVDSFLSERNGMINMNNNIYSLMRSEASLWNNLYTSDKLFVHCTMYKIQIEPIWIMAEITETGKERTRH